MKKRTKIIFSVLVVAAVLAATYRVVNRPPSASLESSDQMEEIIASSGCMACHTANPELPFYASLPVAGKLVKEDARLAYRSFDMTPMLEALKKRRESQRGRFGKSREGDIRRHHAYGQILSGALGGFVERYRKADGTFMGEVTACSLLSESAGSCTVEQ